MGRESTAVDHGTWRKATYSGSNGGACVETAEAANGAVAVRDTTNREGCTLILSGKAFGRFTAGIKSGVVAP